jgi:acyl phosphate:glycerol-3-phosphate acyltransferase
LAYLIGSIPVGVLVGHAQGFDPRAVGSGNIGMTNVARAGGKGPAAITFVGDILKGLLPVLLARFTGLAPSALALVAFAAFAGSIASIFLRFKGGRGVSAALGIWLGLAPLPILFVLAVFLAFVGTTRIVSLASISAAIALPPAVAAANCPRSYILLAVVVSAVVLLRHRENIHRLIDGTEPKIGAPKASGPSAG